MSGKLSEQQSYILADYMQAFEDKEIKNYEEAIKEISLIIQLDQKIYDAYILRGSFYLEIEQWLEAENDFSRAIQLNPKESEGYYLYADAIKNTQNKKAKEYYKKALSLNYDDPYYDDPQAYSHKGIFLFEKKKFQEALDCLNEATNLYTESTPIKCKKVNQLKIHLNLKLRLGAIYAVQGLCLRDLGNCSEAFTKFNKALQFEPHNPRYLYERGTDKMYFPTGVLNQRMNKLPEALADYSECIALIPNDFHYRESRIMLYEYMEKLQEALADYSYCIKLDPNNVLVIQNRAKLYERMDKLPEALADYSKCIELDPKETHFRQCRAEIQEYMDKFVEALVDYSKCIELDPNNFHFRERRAKLYERMNKLPEALADYSKCIELDPKNVHFIQCRAKLYEQMNKLPEALANYSEAIRLNANQDYIYSQNLMSRGKIYIQMKKFHQALEDYSKVVQLNPKNRNYIQERDKILQLLNKQTQRRTITNQYSYEADCQQETSRENYDENKKLGYQYYDQQKIMKNK